MELKGYNIYVGVPHTHTHTSVWCCDNVASLGELGEDLALSCFWMLKIQDV